MNFLPLALKFAPYAAAVAAILAAYQFAPIIGVNAQRHRLEAARDTYRNSAMMWHSAADDWKASFKKSEAFRAEENKAAVAAVDATQAQCDARVANARKSARAVKRILDVPVKLDTNNCPVRSTVGADLLRDALHPR